MWKCDSFGEAVWCNSFENILHQIRKIVSESVGLVTLQIRNYSQGWSQNKTLVIATKEPKQFVPVQLSLF